MRITDWQLCVPIRIPSYFLKFLAFLQPLLGLGNAIHYKTNLFLIIKSMATDISSLLGKTANSSQAAATETIPANEKLTSDEFNMLVKAVQENQASVKLVKMGSQIYTPEDGVVTLPYTAQGSEVGLKTTDDTNSLVSITGKAILHLLFVSTQGGYDTGNSGVLYIQTYANGQWITQGTVAIASKNLNAAYDEIDITDYLSTGSNRVRVYVMDDGFGSQSNPIIFESVVLTSLKIELASEYYRPVTTNYLQPSYYIYGAGVKKTLHLKVSGKTAEGKDDYREITYSIGTNTYTTNSYTVAAINDTSSQTVKVINHGVHTIEAWVTCVDGAGKELESEHIVNSLMLVVDSSDTTPYLLVQNLKKNVVNYEQTVLFDYAVYNPSGEAIDVAIVLGDYDNTVEYLRLESDTMPNTANSVETTVEVENDTDDILYSYLHIYRVVSGKEYNFLKESTGTESEIITVDNTEKFSPTSGADFFLNPKVRNNSEANPARILNAAKGNVELSGAKFKNFGFVNDGWLKSEDKQSVLRVLAGQTVTIPYEPWSNFMDNSASSMTLELDFKIRNITNETDPIIQCCSIQQATGNPLGLFMRPLDGFINTLTQSTEADQNFAWMENVRTHIAINVVHALRSSATNTTTVSLVRVFVNGRLNREFPFDTATANEFITSAGHGGIRIGQDDADIDIYSIRCYKKALSSDDCMQDYLSSLPTSTEKVAFRNANDIMLNGEINYALAKEKYNVLVWHGYEPNRMSMGNQTGWLEISFLNADGTPDNAHSGTIGKKYGRLPDKGQGSTAKTYYWWNQQWDVNKMKDNAGKTISDDGWVDGNGDERGNAYQLTDDVPAATKLVLKINYASSMQSHKQGATELYNLLHTAICGQNSMQKADPKARVAVLERPVLYFLQTPDDSEPVFHGLGTFGPGKMDKKTWGYSSSKFPDFAMLEGSDNNKPLTDMRVPWDDKVTYNVDEEYFEYCGDGNLDFDAGITYDATDDEGHVKGQPSDTIIDYYKTAWNWLFMHNPRIKPYTDGNLSTFQDDSTVDTSYQYWMTQAGGGAALYDLMRYDFVDKKWVPAGLPDSSNLSGYATKNLKSLYNSAVSGIATGAWSELNTAFISAIVSEAREEVGDYFNKKSLLFHYCFVNHLIAGTDNCSKNTYYALDPVTHLIELHQDDLDTIFKTDNSGYQIKPYYIDRLHPYSEDGELLYTEGGGNVLFNLIELMWEGGNNELANMMNTILNTMANLITADDQKNGIEKSAWGCFQKYFFSIQEYFPAVAFNETARIRYEYPTMLGYVSDRNVKPISQSLGDQLQAEKQYMKRRLVYASSYGAYGEFALNGDNGFGFNTYPRIDGSSPTAILDVTPHQYLYPTARVGQTLRNPHVRVKPFETYHFVIDNSGNLGDTVCGLKGGNYYRSFGNIGDLSVKPTNDFTLQGDRLVEIIANPTGNPEFRPTRLNIGTALVKKISLKGEKQLGGQLDLSVCTRLATLDIRDTKITGIKLPASDLLTNIRLGSYITALEIKDLPKLSQITLDGYDYLTSFAIGENVGQLDLYQTIAELYDAKHAETDVNKMLTTLVVNNVNWKDASVDLLSWLLTIDNLKITGTITLANSEYLTFEMKKKLIEKFGDIDSQSNSLYISYVQRTISSIQIAGDNTFREPGTRKFTLIPNSPNANNFSSMKWSISSSAYATVDENTGVVTCTKISSTALTVTLKCTIVTTDRTMETTFPLYMYDRPAELGDYVFADGTYSDMLNPLKTVVGICFYLGTEDAADGKPDRRMVAVSDMSCLNGSTSCPWGLYPGDDTNGITGITIDGMNSAYDVAGITNIGSSGLEPRSDNNSVWYIGDNNYRDEETGDKYGFKTGFSATTGAGDLQLVKPSEEQKNLIGVGYSDERKIPSGQQHTLAIMQHRNQILDAISYALPSSQYKNGIQTQSEIENLRECIETIIANMGETKYQQYYYPAASYCYAYEPTNLLDGEELADRFKAHNWYLPSSGELARLYWYYNRGVDDEKNIFRTALASGKMTNFTSSYRWSSSEFNTHNAWGVNFGNGNFNSYCYKCSSGVVRAVSAF